MIFSLFLPYIFWLVMVLTLFCLILKMSTLSWFLSVYWEYLFLPLPYPDVMSVPDVKLYFLYPEEGNILFSFYSVSLVFYWGTEDIDVETYHSAVLADSLLWWCDVDFSLFFWVVDLLLFIPCFFLRFCRPPHDEVFLIKPSVWLDL